MSDMEVAKAEPGAELAAALAAVQAELPEVKKNRNADVSNKDGRFLYSYAYADLADVSAAIMPILGRHGLAFTAFPGHQPDGKFGLRYYLMHSSGAQLEGFYEIVDQGGMQMVGGRITYARRYCLCAVTGVAADEDVDARGDQQPARTAQRTARRRQGAVQTAFPADSQARTAGAPSSPAAAAGEAPQPPLPGEEEVSQPGTEPAGDEPDETDYDTPGTVTRPQLTRIGATFTDLGFTKDERDQRLVVASEIIGRDIGSSSDLSRNEAKVLIDTLASCDGSREKLIALLAAGEAPEGGGSR